MALALSASNVHLCKVVGNSMPPVKLDMFILKNRDPSAGEFQKQMRQVETASMVKELAKLGSSTTKLILLQGVSGVEKAHFAKHLTDEVQSINPEPGGYRCILELPFYDVEDITYNSNADLLASFYSQIPFLDTSGNKPGNAGPPGLKPGHKNKALSSVAGQSRAEDSLSLSDSGDSAFVSPSVVFHKRKPTAGVLPTINADMGPSPLRDLEILAENLPLIFLDSSSSSGAQSPSRASSSSLSRRNNSMGGSLSSLSPSASSASTNFLHDSTDANDGGSRFSNAHFDCEASMYSILQFLSNPDPAIYGQPEPFTAGDRELFFFPCRVNATSIAAGESEISTALLRAGFTEMICHSPGILAIHNAKDSDQHMLISLIGASDKQTRASFVITTSHQLKKVPRVLEKKGRDFALLRLELKPTDEKKSVKFMQSHVGKDEKLFPSDTGEKHKDALLKALGNEGSTNGTMCLELLTKLSVFEPTYTASTLLKRLEKPNKAETEVLEVLLRAKKNRRPKLVKLVKCVRKVLALTFAQLSDAVQEVFTYLRVFPGSFSLAAAIDTLAPFRLGSAKFIREAVGLLNDRGFVEQFKFSTKALDEKDPFPSWSDQELGIVSQDFRVRIHLTDPLRQFAFDMGTDDKFCKHKRANNLKKDKVSNLKGGEPAGGRWDVLMDDLRYNMMRCFASYLEKLEKKFTPTHEKSRKLKGVPAAVQQLLVPPAPLRAAFLLDLHNFQASMRIASELTHEFLTARQANPNLSLTDMLLSARSLLGNHPVYCGTFSNTHRMYALLQVLSVMDPVNEVDNYLSNVYSLGVVFRNLGAFTEASACFTYCQAAFSHDPDTINENVLAVCGQASLALKSGEAHIARSYYEEARESLRKKTTGRQAGSVFDSDAQLTPILAGVLNMLGKLYTRKSGVNEPNLQKAEACFLEAGEASMKSNDFDSLCISLVGLAEMHLTVAEAEEDPKLASPSYAKALEYFESSLQVAGKLNDLVVVCKCLNGLASVCKKGGWLYKSFCYRQSLASLIARFPSLGVYFKVVQPDALHLQ